MIPLNYLSDWVLLCILLDRGLIIGSSSFRVGEVAYSDTYCNSSF